MKRTPIGDVLILTFNITLANYKLGAFQIARGFSWQKIDIHSYHKFFRLRASECGLHVAFHSYDDEDFFSKAQIDKKIRPIGLHKLKPPNGSPETKPLRALYAGSERFSYLSMISLCLYIKVLSGYCAETMYRLTPQNLWWLNI